MFADILVMIKGAGDLASGTALRLHRCGFAVVMTELPHPLAIRRTAAFADAVYDGETRVEGVTARRVEKPGEINAVLRDGEIPIAIDPAGEFRRDLRPQVFIDATVSKHNHGVSLTDAPLVIALGPGFEAGREVHAVIETKRGHTLGRVTWNGFAEADTGIPGQINGASTLRVIHAPAGGKLRHIHQIGDMVIENDIIAIIDEIPIRAAIDGVLRGLLHENTPVTEGLKIADIDPRGDARHCFTVSDKALAVAGGALEAILTWMSQPKIN